MIAPRTRGTNLTVIGASAGSGKTHRLTQEVLGAVADSSQAAVPLDGLVAVTYTRRAHAELESRIRRALLASQHPDRAARMPLAHIGTVHSVCLRWVQENAVQAGLCPEIEVLADPDRALPRVVEEALPAALQAELEELADRLEIAIDTRTDQYFWTRPVIDVLTLARHGRIPASALPEMAGRAIHSLFALLPPPSGDPDHLDAALAIELEVALRALESGADRTQATRNALERVRAIQRELRLGNVNWKHWLELSTLVVGKASRSAVEPLIQAAETHLHHPRFQRDLRRFTELVYRAAGDCLEHYAQWKRERGIVDYVDMVDMALHLLDQEDVACDLAEALELIVVDELQDSSPIQLALFLRLHALANRSVWVGDPKQCIFEYAGADPALMDAVLAWAASSGGATERLERNYRSRPELVELASELFASAFARHGMAPSMVVTQPFRARDGLERLPPVGLFYLQSGKKDEDALALACGVARLLESAADTPVVDPMRGVPRPVQPGDVAILVRTNLEADRIADALGACGVRASLARTGLMSTPEGVAVGAALRYVLDPRDQLSLAELEALHGFPSGGPDAFLEDLVRRSIDPVPAARPVPRWQERLDEQRSASATLTPLELVDAVIVALDLATLASRWPDAPQRLANLDCLRKFATIYEARCEEEGEGASLAGLLRFLRELSRPMYQRGEERAADEQHAAADAGAVTVLTYHRAKGLEWPVVVLGSVDEGPRRRIFEVRPETDRGALDPDAPLSGRWIRYWPWPFGKRTKAPLMDRALASETGRSEIEREQRERARLLYVGFTRARDHLVIAVRKKNERLEKTWLDELTTSDHRPILGFPIGDEVEPGLTVERVGEGAPLVVPCRLWHLAPDPPKRRSSSEPLRWFGRSRRPGVAPAYRIRPSRLMPDDLDVPALRIVSVEIIHAPLLLTTRPDTEWSAVGNAFHAFLAAHRPESALADQRNMARRILEAFGAATIATADQVVGAAVDFRAFALRYAGKASWHHEIVVESFIDSAHGERKIDGRLDLLLEEDDGLVIVDHKSFPGAGNGLWRKRASEYAPQLGAYVVATRKASALPIRECWVHFTVGGAVVRMAPGALLPARNGRERSVPHDA